MIIKVSWPIIISGQAGGGVRRGNLLFLVSLTLSLGGLQKLVSGTEAGAGGKSLFLNQGFLVMVPGAAQGSSGP